MDRRRRRRSHCLCMDLHELMPFAIASGVELEAAAADEVRGSLAWTEDRCTAGGVLHGGALMTLADTVGALCAFLNLPDGAGTSTIESKTNFVRAVRSGSVRATARPLHVGRQTNGHHRGPRRRRPPRRLHHADPGRPAPSAVLGSRPGATCRLGYVPPGG